MSVTVAADSCTEADGWDTPLVVLGLERGNIIAERDDDERGLEVELGFQLRVDVIGREVALEVGDVRGPDLRLFPGEFGDPARDEVDVILLQRARGHAPVVVPADFRRGPVPGDAVAEEEDAVDLDLRAQLGVLVREDAGRGQGRKEQQQKGPTVQHARETVLHENLWQMRRAIDQYRADKGKLPQSVDDLVESKYLHEKPMDPITQKNEWNEVQGDDTSNSESSGGLVDVKTLAEGQDTDGKAYSEY